MEELTSLFGKSGSYFYNIAHGRDDRPVSSDRVRKSLGKETTIGEDTDNIDMMLDILREIARNISLLLDKSGRYGHTVTLKVKYFDFRQVTRSITVDKPPTCGEDIMFYVRELLSKTEAGDVKVRLLGISISGFSDEIKAAPVASETLQLSFSFMK